jgi:phosphoglycolate phosphatase-like HAD superfamily hydrolase
MTCSVLLDLDGTLVDTYPGILASCHAALRALGHKPDESFDIRLSGVSAVAVVQRTRIRLSVVAMTDTPQLN